MLAVLVQNPNLAEVPGFRGASNDTLLRLISLRQDDLGDVLHQIPLGEAI